MLWHSQSKLTISISNLISHFLTARRLIVDIVIHPDFLSPHEPRYWAGKWTGCSWGAKRRITQCNFHNSPDLWRIVSSASLSADRNLTPFDFSTVNLKNQLIRLTFDLLTLIWNYLNRYNYYFYLIKTNLIKYEQFSTLVRFSAYLTCCQETANTPGFKEI